MTSPPLDYTKEAADRLTRASNSFPEHIGRDGVGTIRVRQNDVFAILGEREAILADNARKVKALERLRDCDWTIGIGDRMDPVRDIARQALSGANHAD